MFSIFILFAISLMFYIGCIEIRAGLQSVQSDTAVVVRKKSLGIYFTKGILSSVLNPKVGVFYIVFLPQFISEGHVNFSNVFLLGIVHVTIGMLWLTFCSFFVDYAQSIMKNKKLMNMLMILAGSLIILFANIVLWTIFFAS